MCYCGHMTNDKGTQMEWTEYLGLHGQAWAADRGGFVVYRVAGTLAYELKEAGVSRGMFPTLFAARMHAETLVTRRNG